MAEAVWLVAGTIALVAITRKKGQVIFSVLRGKLT